MKALYLLLGVLGPLAVVGGWVWAGVPHGYDETLCCVLVHVVAVFSTSLAALLWGVDG